jgi:hypothetical protein
VLLEKKMIFFFKNGYLQGQNVKILRRGKRGILFDVLERKDIL